MKSFDYSFSKTGHANTFRAIRRQMMKPSTVCFAIARCTHSVKSAVAILSTPKRVSKTASTACCLTAKEGMTLFCLSFQKLHILRKEQKIM